MENQFVRLFALGMLGLGAWFGNACGGRAVAVGDGMASGSSAGTGQIGGSAAVAGYGGESAAWSGSGAQAGASAGDTSVGGSVSEQACSAGMADYANLRATLLDKYQRGCQSDAECTAVPPSNLCERGCAYEAIWSMEAASFSVGLSNAALMDCATCPQMAPQGPCPPAPLVYCFMGECLTAHGPGG